MPRFDVNAVGFLSVYVVLVEDDYRKVDGRFEVVNIHGPDVYDSPAQFRNGYADNLSELDHVGVSWYVLLGLMLLDMVVKDAVTMLSIDSS